MADPRKPKSSGIHSKKNLTLTSTDEDPSNAHLRSEGTEENVNIVLEPKGEGQAVFESDIAMSGTLHATDIDVGNILYVDKIQERHEGCNEGVFIEGVHFKDGKLITDELLTKDFNIDNLIMDVSTSGKMVNINQGEEGPGLTDTDKIAGFRVDRGNIADVMLYWDDIDETFKSAFYHDEHGFPVITRACLMDINLIHSSNTITEHQIPYGITGNNLTESENFTFNENTNTLNVNGVISMSGSEVALKSFVEYVRDTLNTRIDDEVDTLNDRVDTEVITLNTRIDAEVDTLNERIDDEVDALNNRVDAEVDALDTRITEEVQDLNNTIVTEVDALNTRIDDEISDISTEIQTVSSTLDSKINDEVANLDSTVQAVSSTLDGKIDTEVNDLNTTIQSVSSQLQSEIDSGSDDLNTAIQNVSSQLQTNLDQEVDTLNATISATSGALDITIEDEINAVNTSIEGVSANLQDLIDTEVNDLESDISGLQNDIDGLFPGISSDISAVPNETPLLLLNGTWQRVKISDVTEVTPGVSGQLLYI